MRKISVISVVFLAAILMSTISFIPNLSAQEEIVYRGVFNFPVPPFMAQKLSEYDNINNWLFFSENTRWIDSNNDGVYDFVAISLGSNAGYGAQLRYNLFYRANSTSPELGPWYWCVIADSQGNTVFERFNR